MKLFFHVPHIPEVKLALHQREMRVENFLNRIRFVFLTLIFLFDFILILKNQISYNFNFWFELIFFISILPVFYIAHRITSGKKYHPWIKYVSVAMDLGGSFFYSQIALSHYIGIYPIDKLSFLEMMTIIYLFFNLLSVLRGGTAIVIFSATLTLLFNGTSFIMNHENMVVLAYCSAFIVFFSIFNLFATNTIIENTVNNNLLGKAMADVKNANAEIEAQNDMLVEQRDKISHQKKEITDSIHYALRIQTAILPPDYYVKKCLADSFIFYAPKDVVSGDFYYVESVDEYSIFTAVDCTGHGVPGAMMSVIGYNLLNQAVKLKKMTKPSDILQFLDTGVTETLRQIAGESGVNDGMDLGLCSLNTKTLEAQYAGAFNPFVYIQNGEMKEITADKFPIGSNYEGVADNYTNHVMQLSKGDTIYLYSDGYADQFGGPKDKKFKYKQLHTILFENYKLPMDKQKEILKKTYADWKGENEQTDDVIVIGVRV
jgi:serine phosphatase RsbU (regulator of sigma subunit)